MKKHKQKHAEELAAQNLSGAEAKGEIASAGQIKQVVNMNDIDDDATITKSNPVPFPYSNQAKPSADRPVDNYESSDSQPNSFDATLLKPLAGGLQPIIAPKGQVQLNPVVVPVAFVPYATQNQPMLQLDRRKPAPAVQQAKPKLEEISDQPLDKHEAKAAKKRDKSVEIVGENTIEDSKPYKKNKVKNRIFSAILFIITLGFFAFIVLNFLADKLNIDSIILCPGEPDIVRGWMNFTTTDIIAQIPLFIFTGAAVIALATLITAFVSICNGRGYHLWIAALLMVLFTAAGTLLCAFDIVGDIEVGLNPIGENSFAWRLVMVSVLLLIFSLIFIPRKAKALDDEDDDLSDLI